MDPVYKVWRPSWQLVGGDLRWPGLMNMEPARDGAHLDNRARRCAAELVTYFRAEPSCLRWLIDWHKVHPPETERPLPSRTIRSGTIRNAPCPAERPGAGRPLCA